MQFSMVTVPVYSLNNFPFLHILSNHCLFMTATLARLKVIPHCGMALIFTALVISDSKHLSLCLLVLCISSSQKCLFSHSAQFFNQIVSFIVVDLYGLFI